MVPLGIIVIFVFISVGLKTSEGNVKTLPGLFFCGMVLRGVACPGDGHEMGMPQGTQFDGCWKTIQGIESLVKSHPCCL